MTAIWGGEVDDQITRDRAVVLAMIARWHERVTVWIGAWEPSPLDSCPPHGTRRPEGWDR